MYEDAPLPISHRIALAGDRAAYIVTPAYYDADDLQHVARALQKMIADKKRRDDLATAEYLRDIQRDPFTNDTPI